MATIEIDRARQASDERSLRIGSWLMDGAAAGFIGYAAIFLIRNFTDSFLEGLARAAAAVTYAAVA